MFYVYLIMAICILFLLKDLIQEMVWFHEIYPNYSYVRNVLHHGNFVLKLDNDAEMFMVSLLKLYNIQLIDSKYLIITDTMTFRVEVLNRILILHHEDFNATVINTGNISFETIKCIKAAQKKLTQGIKY